MLIGVGVLVIGVLLTITGGESAVAGIGLIGAVTGLIMGIVGIGIRRERPDPNAAPVVAGRPGSRLISVGLILLALGAFLFVLNVSSTSVEIIPGTFQTMEVQGSPSPGAWLLLISGVVLTLGGFGKRVLAALESR